MAKVCTRVNNNVVAVCMQVQGVIKWESGTVRIID